MTQHIGSEYFKIYLYGFHPVNYEKAYKQETYSKFGCTPTERDFVKSQISKQEYKSLYAISRDQLWIKWHIDHGVDTELYAFV